MLQVIPSAARLRNDLHEEHYARLRVPSARVPCVVHRGNRVRVVVVCERAYVSIKHLLLFRHMLAVRESWIANLVYLFQKGLKVALVKNY